MCKVATKTGNVEVAVKLPNGKTTTLEVFLTDSLTRIYKHVAEHLKVPQDRLVIKYTGKVLSTDHTVGYLGICRETVLKAEVIVPKPLKLYIKGVCGSLEIESIDNVSSVLHLKERIQSKTSIVTDEQVLKFQGSELLKCNQSLHAAGIFDEATVILNKSSSVSSSKAATSKEYDETTGTDEDQNAYNEEAKEALLQSFSPGSKRVDVVFSFDTTGSMYSYLVQVRTELDRSIRRLLRDIPGIRIGMIAHGDFCDYNSTYVTRVTDLTTDVDELVKFARDTPMTNGGDSPECYEYVLHKAQTLDWAEDSAKALVIIADCEPHPPSYTDQAFNWHEELDILSGRGIKVYGVQAGDMDHARPFYQQLAEKSGGCYIDFRSFELITDMFCAVCYKESSACQFEAFCDAVEEEGRLTDETRNLFEQIKDGAVNSLEPSDPENDQCSPAERYVSAPWWDFSQDTTTSPQYYYIAETDSWRGCAETQAEEIHRVSHHTAGLAYVPDRSHRGDRSARRHKQSKHNCIFTLFRKLKKR